MFYQNDFLLSDELIFKLLSISMMAVDRIQRTRSRTVKRKSLLFSILLEYFQQSISEPILFAGIAFAVALFSHIVNHTIIRLQNAFYALHDARVKTNENDDNEQDEEERRQAEIKEKQRRRMKQLMSRRRRRRSASLSEHSDASERSMSDDREQLSSDDEHSEEEIPDYLSGDSSEDDLDDETRQIIQDEKDKEAEGLSAEKNKNLNS